MPFLAMSSMPLTSFIVHTPQVLRPTWCQAFCRVHEMQTCLRNLLPSRRQTRKQTVPRECICDRSSMSLGTQRHILVGESGKAFWRECLDCSQFRLFSWNVSQAFYTQCTYSRGNNKSKILQILFFILYYLM